MSKKKTQKILIPKGTINPDEDTLIEIPLCLKDQAVVVATRTGSEKILRPRGRKKDTTEVNFTLDDTSTSRDPTAPSYMNTDSFSPSFNSTFQPSYHESEKSYPMQRQNTNYENEGTFHLSADQQPTYFEPDKPFQQSTRYQPTFYDSDKPFQQSIPRQQTFSDSEKTIQHQPTFYDSDKFFQHSVQPNQSSFQQTVLDVPTIPNLDETERAERKMIQKKLEDFQQARRELFKGASTVATNSSQLVPQVDFTDDFESSFPLSSTLTPPGISSSPCKGYVRDTSILSRRPNRGKADSPVPSPVDEDDDSILPLYKNSKVNSEKSKTSGYLSHEETCVLNRKPNSPRVSYRSFDEEKIKIPSLFDGDDDEEEKICLCLSKSINSVSKSSNGSCKRR